MTEYDLFVKCIPMIAEIVVTCRRMGRQEYDAWKLDVLCSAPETAKNFIGKVYAVIDFYVVKEA